MIRIKYCTLTVIHFHATLPHVPAAPLPRNSLLPTHARLPILQAPDRSSLFNFRRSLFTCRQPLAIRRCSYEESASISFHGAYGSFVFILLRTLLHRAERYLLSFLWFPHSLRKTPGVAYPLADHGIPTSLCSFIFALAESFCSSFNPPGPHCARTGRKHSSLSCNPLCG